MQATASLQKEQCLVQMQGISFWVGDELGGDQLGEAGEEGAGERLKVLGGRGGYGWRVRV